jgi:hypothetical protein
VFKRLLISVIPLDSIIFDFIFKSTNSLLFTIKHILLCITTMR